MDLGCFRDPSGSAAAARRGAAEVLVAGFPDQLDLEADPLSVDDRLTHKFCGRTRMLWAGN
jgi:hypothetical protein